jgi:hypothetical protein
VLPKHARYQAALRPDCFSILRGYTPLAGRCTLRGVQRPSPPFGPERGGATATGLSAALAALVIVTAVLTTLVLKPPARARVQVGAPQAIACPSGEHAPACYKFPVTNAGTEQASLQCTVTSAVGTQALFLSSVPTYAGLPVPPGKTETLWVKVDTADGGTVKEPAVTCAAT